MQLEGLRAVIVGGASGMARATADRIVAGDGKVAIIDRPISDGIEVAKALHGTFHPADVTDATATKEAIDAAVDALGGIDVMVNTAGGAMPERTLSKTGPHSLDTFRATVELNLISAFNVSRLVAEHMVTNEPNEGGERGLIINTASIAAFEGQIGQVAYSAAKGGLTGMTLTMARDLGSLGIRVMTIAPSLFATGLTAAIPDEYGDALVKDAAFPRRMGTPDEYAALAVAIIENPMLNGSTIRLDAGQRFAPK